MAKDYPLIKKYHLEQIFSEIMQKKSNSVIEALARLNEEWQPHYCLFIERENTLQYSPIFMTPQIKEGVIV